VSDAELLDEVDSGVSQPDANGDPVPVTVPFHAAIRLTSPLRLDQFTVELATAADAPLGAVAVQASGALDSADDDHPVALWTESELIQPNVLLATALAHSPDPAWQPTGAAAGLTIDDLREKVRGGQLLAADELQLAVRLLLLAGA
jgi:hypothetical protein